MLWVRCPNCGGKAPAVVFGPGVYEVQLHVLPCEQSNRGRTCLPSTPLPTVEIVVLSMGKPTKLLGKN